MADIRKLYGILQDNDGGFYTGWWVSLSEYENAQNYIKELETKLTMEEEDGIHERFQKAYQA